MGRGGRSEFNESEFDALFEAHYSELRRYVSRRVEDRAGADDVLAETFATAWRRRDQMPDPAVPWLFGVCHKVIANHRRSEKRRARLFARLGASRLDLGRDPAEIHAERSEIAGAFAGLSESQREVLRLVAWEGLSATDAATALGCSPAAFRVRLHRARTELAKRLGVPGHERREDPDSPDQGFQEAQ
jgi:RNA polymerase sigma-70 factor (ECF subfamily)